MVDNRIDVHYVCQSCSQPLKLHTSFNSLGEHTLAELSLPIYASTDVDLESQAASLDHLIPASRLGESGNGTNDFTLVGGEGETGTFSHKMKVTAGLFDLVSGNSEIDHPLCEECTDAMLDLMDEQLKLTEDEWSLYSKFLKKLESESAEEGIEELNNELKNLLAEEGRLMDELAALQQEEKAMERDIEEQGKEKERLEKEEDRYWREYSKHRREYMITEDELESLKCQLAYAEAHLEKLKKTNVFNATFHIWHSGHFGTINNLRLGRLPSAPVEWSEINAAWGQTALLLTALARKINLTFDKYRLVPYGNHSYIKVLAEQKDLPLFGYGGFRFLWDTKFDAAMVAFLDCLNQFKEEVEKGDSTFKIPYKMDNGKIEDYAHSKHSYPIKTQFNSEEQWTKALKFLLTNLKWALAYVCSQFDKNQLDNR
ncbi:beclin-1-like protein [Nilaparvata lugens]|uniref:Autophagy-related protein 6 n=1 Tax=Nilaparvata lugens TaxID=108931 RepID=A0A4Y1N7H4_NILLU|nr:beclin-1-like protein [Nilaparvata lugens]AWW05873.1 autophagy-related protein 6 [Nilaparvata lugens]